MDTETYILAPSVIADKARQLHSVGLHRQALELLQRNCVEASVYPTHVQMKLARELNARTAHSKALASKRLSAGNVRRSKRRRKLTTDINYDL